MDAKNMFKNDTESQNITYITKNDKINIYPKYQMSIKK